MRQPPSSSRVDRRRAFCAVTPCSAQQPRAPAFRFERPIVDRRRRAAAARDRRAAARRRAPFRASSDADPQPARRRRLRRPARSPDLRRDRRGGRVPAGRRSAGRAASTSRPSCCRSRRSTRRDETHERVRGRPRRADADRSIPDRRHRAAVPQAAEARRQRRPRSAGRCSSPKARCSICRTRSCCRPSCGSPPARIRYLRVTWDDTNSARIPRVPAAAAGQRAGRRADAAADGAARRSSAVRASRAAAASASGCPAANLPIVALDLDVGGEPRAARGERLRVAVCPARS